MDGTYPSMDRSAGRSSPYPIPHATLSLSPYLPPVCCATILSSRSSYLSLQSRLQRVGKEGGTIAMGSLSLSLSLSFCSLASWVYSQSLIRIFIYEIAGSGEATGGKVQDRRRLRASLWN